jgi:hypothetical protein
MTAVTVTYILVEKVGFGIAHGTGTILGLAAAAIALGWFLAVRPRLAVEPDSTIDGVRPTEVERTGDNLAC